MPHIRSAAFAAAVAVLATFSLKTLPAYGDDPTTVAEVQMELQKRLGLAVLRNEAGGLSVEKVLKDSPAEKNGLRVGDTLLLANKKVLVEPASLYEIVKQMDSGDWIRLTASRDDSVATVALRLQGDGAENATAKEPADNQFLLLGMSVVKGVDVTAVVYEVTPSSPAWNAGIREDDVIIELDSFQPETFEELGDGARKMLAETERTRLPIKVKRDDEYFVANVILKPESRGVERRQGRQESNNSSHQQSRDVVAQLLQPVATGPEAGYRIAGHAAFRNDFLGMRAEISSTGLPAGTYSVAVLDHGNLSELYSNQAQNNTGAQMQLVLGTLAVNAQGVGQMTQAFDNLRSEALAGRIVILYPETPNNQTGNTRNSATRNNGPSVNTGQTVNGATAQPGARTQLATGPTAAAGVIGFANHFGAQQSYQNQQGAGTQQGSRTQQGTGTEQGVGNSNLPPRPPIQNGQQPGASSIRQPGSTNGSQPRSQP